MSYILQLKDDHIHRTADKPYLYLSAQYLRDGEEKPGGHWADLPEQAFEFPTVEEAVTAAQIEHDRIPFGKREEITILVTEDKRKVRTILRSELQEYIKPAVPQKVRKLKEPVQTTPENPAILEP